MKNFNLRNQHRAKAIALVADLIAEDRCRDIYEKRGSLMEEAADLAYEVITSGVDPRVASALKEEGWSMTVQALDLGAVHAACLSRFAVARTWAALTADAENGICDPSRYVQPHGGDGRLRLPSEAVVYALPAPSGRVAVPRTTLASVLALAPRNAEIAGTSCRLSRIVTKDVPALNAEIVRQYHGMAEVVQAFARCHTSGELVATFPKAASLFEEQETVRPAAAPGLLQGLGRHA